MAEGLSDLWGLAESAVSDAVSEVQQQARAAMDEALGAVNSSLQSAITSAPPADHAALAADRDKVIEAYQIASSHNGQDGAAGQAAMDRVLAAAGALGGKAAQTAEAAAAARDEWGAKEEQLDDMALQAAQLEDAGHPKSEKLRELTETIRAKAAGHQYGDCTAAVEQLQPKLDAMMAEHEALVAQAKAAQAAGAGPEEAGWWDRAKDAAADAYDWATGDDGEAEPDERGAAKPSSGEAEEKTWWDEAKEAAGDAYDWATGADDDESGKGDEVVTQYGYNDEDEGEEVSDTGEGRETKTIEAYDKYWDDLTEAEQRAWGALGWDEARWNNNNPPASQSKSWSELSQSEREAAKSLGYDERSWDREGGEESKDPLNRGAYWDELPSPVQMAWGILGWDKDRWNNNNPPPSQFKSWSELTPAEQEAAGALGYDENSWNQEGDSGVAGKVEALKTRSNNERALKARILSLGYEEVDNFAEYNTLYEEVGVYLGNAAADYQFSEQELANWSTAIGLLAAKRRAIAGRMASNVFEEQKFAAARQLSGLRKSLANERASLASIEKAFQVAGDMQDGVEASLTLKDWLSTLENCLAFAGDPTKLQAVDSAIAELVNQVDPAGDQINHYTGKLAAYVKERAAQLEGYESKAALLSAINATVANIRNAVRELAFYVDKYEAAVALESAPGG